MKSSPGGSCAPSSADGTKLCGHVMSTSAEAATRSPPLPPLVGSSSSLGAPPPHDKNNGSHKPRGLTSFTCNSRKEEVPHFKSFATEGEVQQTTSGHSLTSLVLTLAPPTQVNKHSQLPRPVLSTLEKKAHVCGSGEGRPGWFTWHIHLTPGGMYAYDGDHDAPAVPM